MEIVALGITTDLTKVVQNGTSSDAQVPFDPFQMTPLAQAMPTAAQYNPYLEDTANLAQIVPTIASGGVRDAGDVAALSRLDGVLGVIVGTALYEGRVALEDLIRAARTG